MHIEIESQWKKKEKEAGNNKISSSFLIGGIDNYNILFFI